jgi:hypothetical protein
MKKFKVRITQLPMARTGYQVQGSLANDVPAMGGRDYNAYIGKKPKQDSRYLTAVPREDANLEAEGGETAFGDINGDGFPEHKIIKGKRHYEGGVPLNLPDGTFIFSDTKSMKISDCTILKMFNKPCGKKSYTPAELAKPYDINKYRTILEDPDSDEMTRKTAELMIKKFVIKLGALALAQEGKKGFPQGIPEVAKPYMEAVGLSDEDILPNDPSKQQQEEMSEENNIPQMPNDYSEPIEDQPDGTAPTQMPDGQPIAQPMPEEEMSPEMMQQAPMAMYGMSMGGYGLPFYNDPYEMRYGGLKQYGPGDEVKSRPKNTKDVSEEEYGKSTWETRKDEQGEYKYNKTAAAQRQAAKQAVSGSKTGKVSPGWEDAICNMIKAGATYEELTVPSKKNKWTTHMAPGPKSKAIFDKCNTADVQAKFTETEQAIATNRSCPCKDDQGNVIEGMFAKQDENGKCLPETCQETTTTVPGDECYCPDPNDPSKQIAVDCPEDGSEPDCGQGGGQGQYAGMQQQGDYWPEWRTQDKNTFMNTMMEEHGKDYPYMPKIDMPEMEPVYKNWIGEVQSELASEAGRNQQVRRGAGPSSMKQAILTQMQSDPEKAIERTNLDNTNIQNQLERLTNFGVRKENMLNRANANKQYMGELATLNQNYRNESNDWRARKTMALNQGLTNAANTYNQQTEQYAINPRTGIGIFKGGKPIKPEASTNTLDKLMKYKQMYPGFDEKTIMAAMKMDSGNSGFTPADMMYGAYGGPVYMYGGRMFDEGGFVYGDIAYPFIL